MVSSPALSATIVSTHLLGRNTLRTLLMIDLRACWGTEQSMGGLGTAVYRHRQDRSTLLYHTATYVALLTTEERVRREE